MDDKESAFGSTVKGLHGLLGVGVGKDVPQDAASVDRAAGELLCARLEGTLPLNTAVVDAFPAILGKLQKALLPLEGKPLGKVLFDVNTELDIIKSIKDYGKKLAARRDSEADHSAATAIYFAAIASALLFHGERITSYSYEHLRESFNELIEGTWIPQELSRHFSKARKMCEKKGE
jgi:hypothetical protein